MTTALAALLTLALASSVHAQDSDGSNNDDKIWVTADDTPPADRPLTTKSIVNLVDEVSPAVVNIIVAYEGSEFGELFGDGGEPPMPGPEGGIGQGSGFIIHPDGYVLTNYHVVENAQTIHVRRKNDAEYEADVVGVDPKTDIALLKIEADDELPVLPLGDSDEWEVGDFVVAIGNPLGLEHTVTSGIISALGRRNLGVQGDLQTDFIQIDVSINPGNSGGPLVGLTGEVIGINTAINRKGQGIGFAIPIDMIKSLLPQLESKGYVTRSWLGARVQQVTPKLAESFGLDEAHGALVTEVADDSPAADAGLRTGDIIVGFGDRTVRTSDQLSWMVGSVRPGTTQTMHLYRDGKRRSLEVELAEQPDQSRPELPETGSSPPETSPAELQVEVKDLTDSLARQLGAGSRSGVVVTEVADDSAPSNAGLRRRDVIVGVDETAIDSKTDFDAVLDKYGAGDVVRLKLVRGGRVVYIAFER